MAIDPRGSDLKQFLHQDPEAPVVMLNLLRFRDGGKDEYQRYLRHFRPHAEARGAEVIYYGHGGTALVADDGQAWDAVLLVRYPTRRAFSDMVADIDYQAGALVRSDSLIEAVLQPTTEADV